LANVVWHILTLSACGHRGSDDVTKSTEITGAGSLASTKGSIVLSHSPRDSFQSIASTPLSISASGRVGANVDTGRRVIATDIIQSVSNLLIGGSRGIDSILRRCSATELAKHALTSSVVGNGRKGIGGTLEFRVGIDGRTS